MSWADLRRGGFSELFAALEEYYSVLDRNLIYIHIFYLLYFGKCLLLTDQRTDPNRKQPHQFKVQMEILNVPQAATSLNFFYYVFNCHVSV